jgi:hypothetical protein
MTRSGTTRNTSDDATRISGAVLGIVVFLGGIALLAYVFITARDLFNQAPPPVPAPPAAGTAPDPNAPAATTALGQSLMDFGKRLLLLLLMCFAGSVIASRGIELFFKACAAAPPRSSDPTPPPSGGTAAPAPSAPVSSTP